MCVHALTDCCVFWQETFERRGGKLPKTFRAQVKIERKKKKKKAASSKDERCCLLTHTCLVSHACLVCCLASSSHCMWPPTFDIISGWCVHMAQAGSEVGFGKGECQDGGGLRLRGR